MTNIGTPGRSGGVADGGDAAGRREIVLYGIEGSSTTVRARRNLEAALQAVGVAPGILVFVDVLENPQRAYSDGVMATPMLMIAIGHASQRVVGTLDDAEHLRRLLDRRPAK